MIELQQPYMPVCLMAAAVMGTGYDYHLYAIRRFRDEFMHKRSGVIGINLSQLYYRFSKRAVVYVCRYRAVKLLVLHALVRPLGYVFGKLL